MRIVTWILRLLLFLLLLAFAAKNLDPLTLRFYFDLAWQMPVVVALFGFFAFGALFGVLAVGASLLAQRRELQRLRRALRKHEAGGAPPAGSPRPPVAPPSVDA